MSDAKPDQTVATLVAALHEVKSRIDGDIRELVRQLVNSRGNIQDVYDSCDVIDLVIDKALAGAEQGRPLPDRASKRLRGAHSAILNALDRDALDGRPIRGELAQELREAIAESHNHQSCADQEHLVRNIIAGAITPEVIDLVRFALGNKGMLDSGPHPTLEKLEAAEAVVQSLATVTTPAGLPPMEALLIGLYRQLPGPDKEGFLEQVQQLKNAMPSGA